MWNKVEIKRGGFGGREPLETPQVSRSVNNPKAARLTLPGGWATAKRCNIYSDGNGKLAFQFADNGERAVSKPGPHAKADCVVIPSEFAGRIPYGTTAVSLGRDGGMLVLNLDGLAA